MYYRSGQHDHRPLLANPLPLDVAGLLIPGEVIQRMAVISGLLRAIQAGEHAQQAGLYAFTCAWVAA